MRLTPWEEMHLEDKFRELIDKIIEQVKETEDTSIDENDFIGIVKNVLGLE